MEKIIVQKSPPLKGSVLISSSKNAILPILAASLLCEDKCTIENVAPISDVKIMCSMLEEIGSDINFSHNTIDLRVPHIKSHVVTYESVSKMRASFLVMGPLLAKTGRAKISLPGGCPIGHRPVDLHLKGFAAMGAKIRYGHGYVEAKAEKLVGTKIYLDFPSVGATENLMSAACGAVGETVIENAATEPEIVDLADFLIKCGAHIVGAGSGTIFIEGGHSIHGCRYSVIPDRIEGGTFMIAAAATHGTVTIKNVIPSHLKPISAKLREMGVGIEENGDSIFVDASGKIKNTDIKTLPFPGFPTDMQAQMAALMAVSDGSGNVTETVFENRFLYVPELRRMGAKIYIDGRSAIINGVKNMSGAKVNATDLRAGAALICAALTAKGDTEIGNIGYIDRGYYNMEEKLRLLGAKIERRNCI